MAIGNVTVMAPGSFHFIEGQVIIGGWQFHHDGPMPTNPADEAEMLKKSVAAVLDYIGGCLEMMSAPPPTQAATALSEALARDLIKRAKGD